MRRLLGSTLLVATLCFTSPRLSDYPIQPTPLTNVDFWGDFPAPRISTNRSVTVPYDFRKCEETVRIANFAVAGGLSTGGFEGIFFNDSDVFKIIEGAAYCLAGQLDARLDEYLDDLITKIAAAQVDDGYLYTARTINDPRYDFPGRQARWSHLASGHELYNVGHLYEAAVAHWQATGKQSLLNVAIKNADLVCRTFGPGDGQKIDVPGHEEIEIGLVKVDRATGEQKYFDQAKFFIDLRGQSEKRQTSGPYAHDHKPVVEQQEAVGHAVRAGYLYATVADVAVLSGDQAYLTAIRGDRFYPNPLAYNGRSRFNPGMLGRSPWFDCSCCPVNVVRFVPSIAGYVYASTEDDFYVNLYVGGSGRVHVASEEVTLHQQTRCPWNGQVRLDMDVPSATTFGLRLRIPGWAEGRPLLSDLYQFTSESNRGYAIRLNRKRPEPPPVVNGYAVLRRARNAGDSVELDLPMNINAVVAHDTVAANRRRVALERGPIVYCFEAVDNGRSVSDVVPSAGVELQAEHRPDLLGGVTFITGQAHRAVRAWDDSIALRPTAVTAILYYAWSYRQVGKMAVWVACNASAARVTPLPTIASTSRASASHVWQADSVEAVNDQIEPSSSIDHEIPPFILT